VFNHVNNELFIHQSGVYINNNHKIIKQLAIQERFFGFGVCMID